MSGAVPGRPGTASKPRKAAKAAGPRPPKKPVATPPPIHKKETRTKTFGLSRTVVVYARCGAVRITPTTVADAWFEVTCPRCIDTLEKKS